MVVLLSLPLQGCRKGQDEVKIPWKVEQWTMLWKISMPPHPPAH